LRSTGYDIVHTHGLEANRVGLAARLAGTRAILQTAHGLAFQESSHWLPLWFYTLSEKLAARWHDRIFTISDFQRRWALRLGIGNQHKVISIPNGIPKRHAWTDRERLDARSGLAPVPINS
jgi:glycosyltransferase involved in cell wall biosynthesis